LGLNIGEVRIDKREVARRQLSAAIWMFYSDLDAVSIFTLAANSWEIIDSLCEKAGIESLNKETREHIPNDKDLKRDYINPARNFFKHADRDPDATVDFSETDNDAVIFSAVENYIRLYNQSPVEFQVYQLWFLAINHEKVATDALFNVLSQADTVFPNIRAISRQEQKRMGFNTVRGAQQDESVLCDPRTEIIE